MKCILVAATLVLAVACAPAGAPHSKVPTRVDTRHCADVVANAFASPVTPVDGVMQCFDSTMIDMANQSGVYDDRDFMNSIAAQPPVYTSSAYCGIAHNGDYVYELSGDGLAGSRLAITVNKSSGLVSGLNTNDGDACPRGLR